MSPALQQYFSEETDLPSIIGEPEGDVDVEEVLSPKHNRPRPRTRDSSPMDLTSDNDLTPPDEVPELLSDKRNPPDDESDSQPKSSESELDDEQDDDDDDDDSEHSDHSLAVRRNRRRLAVRRSRRDDRIVGPDRVAVKEFMPMEGEPSIQLFCLCFVPISFVQNPKKSHSSTPLRPLLPVAYQWSALRIQIQKKSRSLIPVWTLLLWTPLQPLSTPLRSLLPVA